MRLLNNALVISPSDVASFLSCRHRAGLDLAAANHQLSRPTYADPYGDLLRQHGDAHERAYVDSLRSQVATVLDLKDATDALAQTRAAMVAGTDLIVQARLEAAGMAGVADVLLKVERPSNLGSWSYEVHDTKLARETKGGTVLQLSAYSDMLAQMQGIAPVHLRVVTPGPNGACVVETYRIVDYAAYYRMVLRALRAAVETGSEAILDAHYPEPVDACAMCVWESRCDRRRRDDDHLSFVAGAQRPQRIELTTQGCRTLTEAAVLPVPVPFVPSRGTTASYDRIAHQARVQHAQRTTGIPVFERLPIHVGDGLCRLPTPSAGDVFIDFEGAPFARDGGREFLFGVWANGSYRSWWAVDDAEEQAAFEALVDHIMSVWEAAPDMHVYHFNHYEPTALKKLMGRYVTRAAEIDRLLRAERFVDLFPIARQAVRAGVESYSLKQLEQYSGYVRRVALVDVRAALLSVELALDASAPTAIAPAARDLVTAYNADDCQSTQALRDWLESLRAQWEQEGHAVARPVESAKDEKAVPPVQQEAVELRARILASISSNARDPGSPDHAKWLLAYLIDWHRREVNAEWWEYFRLKNLSEEELLDERKAVAGLQFVQHVRDFVGKNGKPTGSVIHRYSYPAQDLEISGKLKLQDSRLFGEIDSHDREGRQLDIKKGPSMAAHHPSCAFAADVVGTDVLQQSVLRLAERVLAGGDDCGVELLFGNAPRVRAGVFGPVSSETAQEFAVRVVNDIDRTALAIQGPPGAGKTYIGAQMVLALAAKGKRIGVTATSHKVIRNLLDEIARQAAASGELVQIGAKVREASSVASPVSEFLENESALQAITSREVHVLGGTPFLWAREDFSGTVDVLFIDEAGQMSLANVLAVSQAATSLVLLGDPQQLDQPEKATHPDGVGVSALEHVLGTDETMPSDRGIFLPVTWRMSPELTRFTSELFYEGKLESKPGLDRQVIAGTVYDGSHLWFVPVAHDGNQSASMEEVDAVDALVAALLIPASHWIDEAGLKRTLTAADLRVVAPFNAQVNRLAERLGHRGVPVGTVDKFQGQTAAVAIYSMATSRPEDAPRGMEFLFSLNRLNVATSRARCAVFLVASGHLFEAACRTPRQIQLANAMCRYRERARLATVD